MKQSRFAAFSSALPCVFLLTVVLPSYGQYVEIQGDQFTLYGEVYKIKGTNYYPRDDMWADMWSSFNLPVITADAQRISGLGMNAVRILVPYSKGGWDGEDTSSSKIDQLEQVVNVMGVNGVRSVVTLFDWETGFPAAGTSSEADHIQYLNKIVDRLKDNVYVLMWDVKNEPDHPDNYGWCDCNPGRCGNWDCNPSKRDQIVSWLHRMCDAVRARDPNHPVAAGMRWWENLPDVLPFMDVAIFHSYWPNIGTEEIPETKGYMGADQKPILVEEWGWPTNPTPCNRDGRLIYDYNETEQYNVYVNHLTAFADHDIAGGLQWMTYDARTYTSNENESFEKFFGLWTYGYSLKPAGIYYRDNFPVSLFPVVPQPVGPLSSFTTTASTSPARITLNWVNPDSVSFTGTMIRYSDQGYPAGPDDGQLLCDRETLPGSPDSFVHDNPLVGVTYYYTAFPYNSAREYGPYSQRSQIIIYRTDFDGDGDVDMEDYGHLQECLSGSFVPQTDPDCADALLDGDDDVDQVELGMLESCLGGANMPSPPGCGS